MAEQQKSVADLLGDLPDNISGLVTPENIRNTVVSLRTAIGGAEGSGGETTFTLVDTWERINTTLALSNPAVNFDSPSAYAIRYIGEAAAICTANFDIYISGSNNNLIEIGAFVNSVFADVSTTIRIHNSDYNGVFGTAVVQLSPNDVIEMYARNLSGTDPIIVEQLQLTFMGSVA